METQTINALDNAISAFIILFILSAITEKVVSLFRRYPRQFRLILALGILTLLYGLTPDKYWILFLYFAVVVGIALHYWFRDFDDPDTKPTIVEMPLRRAKSILPHIRKYSSDSMRDAPVMPPTIVEKEVMVLSFFVGFVVAFLFRADLISIFIEGHPSALQWDSGDRLFNFNDAYFKLSIDMTWVDIFSRSTIGIILTGFFLSFGSKFFHDLLDTLLQIKNLRRKLNQRETYELDKIEDINAFLIATNSDIVRAVYEENRALFEQHGVRDVSLGSVKTDEGNRMALHVHLPGHDKGNLPPIIHYRLESGTTIPIRVIYHTNVDEPVAQAVRGDTLFPSTGAAATGGSFGVVVRDKVSQDRYIITCSHVVNEGNSTSARGYVQGLKMITIQDSLTNQVVQEQLHFDLRDGMRDIALIGSLQHHHSNSHDGNTVEGFRAIGDEDIANNTAIAFFGRSSGQMEGRIAGRSIHSVSIKYRDRSVELKGLYLAGIKQGDQWSSMSKSGDSGSLIYEKHTGNALGILVAGNSQFTYIMETHQFLDAFGLEIDTD